MTRREGHLDRPRPGPAPPPPAPQAGARPPVQGWGLLVAHRSTLRQIPGETDTRTLMRAIRLLQPYREEPARIELDEDGLTWTDRRGLRFEVTSGRGVTEIRIHVAKLTLRRGRLERWVGAAADQLEDLIRLVSSREAPQG